ncbi:MAG TPA: PQQ-binding-like beta-propeller repeat protein [Noviherbaspirillum sp.]|nr:PQQ-binding-like beta-propeller repeat protein [Noviherbaspirillum sp.]
MYNRFLSGVAALLIGLLAGCGGVNDAPSAAHGGGPRLLSHNSTHETQQYTDADYDSTVHQIYIAYFGRPADPYGLMEYKRRLASNGVPGDVRLVNALYGTHATLRELVDSFGGSAESSALYTGTTRDFVRAIYRNVLNREPDQTGWGFWVDAIERQGLTRSRASLSIMAGALENTTAQGMQDAELVRRRTAVAVRFAAALDTIERVDAYVGDTAAAKVRAMLATVTHATDVSAFQAQIDATVTELVVERVPSVPLHPTPLPARQDATGDAWTAFRGGASHTGYVAATINPASIRQVWQWDAVLPDKPDYAVNRPTIRPIVFANSSFFVTTGIFAYDRQQVFAVDVATGRQKWSRDLGHQTYVSPPAVDSGRLVFTADSGTVSGMGFAHNVHFLDTRDGTELARTPYVSQGAFAAPTIFAGNVYNGCDAYGGLCAWNLTSGNGLWGHDWMAQTDFWTPAADADQLYAYAPPTCAPEFGCLPSGLYIYDRLSGQPTGHIAERISVPLNALRGDFFVSPIIGSYGNVLVYGSLGVSDMTSAIASFEPAQSRLVWKIAGNYQGQPAVAHGVVYALNQNPMRIEAIDERTGQLVWTSTVTQADEQAYVGNIIATRNALVFSTNKRVYIVDINNGSVQWVMQSPGEVAITPDGYMLVSLAQRVPDTQWLRSEESKPAMTNGRILGFRVVP